MDTSPTVRGKLHGAREQTYKPTWDITAYTAYSKHFINIYEMKREQINEWTNTWRVLTVSYLAGNKPQ